MRTPSKSQWMAALFAALLLLVINYGHRNNYSVNDLSSYFNSLDLGMFEFKTESEQQIPETYKFTNNKDPEIIKKQMIEAKVNKLLKEKINEEMKDGRVKLAELRRKVRELESTIDKNQKLLGGNDINKKLITVDHDWYKSIEPNYGINVHSFKSYSKDENNKRQFNPINNEHIIFVTLNGNFGKDRTYEDILELVVKSAINPSKTTLSFLINDPEIFAPLNQYITEYFKIAAHKRDIKDIENFFSKIILIEGSHLFKDNNPTKDAKIQSQKEAKLKNFQLSMSLSNEQYAIFIDESILEIPENTIKKLIESEKDLITVNVESKSEMKDQSSWAFDPSSTEEDKKVKYLSDFDPKSTEPVELLSVSGSLFLANTKLFHNGITFPIFNSIGSTWEKDGTEGIGNQGICLQARALGFSCWGLPSTSVKSV